MSAVITFIIREGFKFFQITALFFDLAILGTILIVISLALTLTLSYSLYHDMARLINILALLKNIIEKLR